LPIYAGVLAFPLGGGKPLFSGAQQLVSLRFGAEGDESPKVSWEDGDRVFYRGWSLGDDGSRSAVMAVTLAAENPPAARQLDRRGRWRVLS
jgi:hypothetical protein